MGVSGGVDHSLSTDGIRRLSGGKFWEMHQQCFVFYILQLFFNFLWSIWFFNCEWYLFAFFWLAALWLLIFATIKSFGAVSPEAANLMLPYLAWVTFAGYLNLGVYFLN